MLRLQQLFSRHTPRFPLGVDAAHRLDITRASDAQLDMSSALMVGLEGRNVQLRFVEHCARVAGFVDKMADAFSLDRAERSDLCAAARLHEIGMIGVPAALVASPASLDEAALAQLRAQASLGARILSTTQTERTCRLVEHQYCDFAQLRVLFKPGSRDVLLAGILRAADVLDTMLHPRPYQADLDPALTAQVLLEGRGTLFHPRAVESLLRLEVMH